ncbi:DUF4345 domain-containing protein [Candidatus Marinimicrobia bacterium MT.SAG.3]|nr:DUF4345 domain-containing protein [Candidatus Marinimicrobia bacterium MT.SAG.3]
MKKTKVLKGILILLGLQLIIFGLWRLLDPISFFNFSGLLLSSDAGLLSEARGAGGAILGFGILIFLGAFKKNLSYTSTIAAMILYLGFGIARIISLVVDGNPPSMIFQGILGEFVFGLLALFALIKYREK